MIDRLKKRPYIFFILPGFLLYSLFVVYPIFSAFFTSLTEWSGIGPKSFVGFDNYIELFKNKQFFTQLTNALKHNLIIFALNTGVVLPVQIYMAYTIYNGIRGYRFFQSMIFAPQFISSTVIVFMGTLVLDMNIGIFNRILEWIGLTGWVRPWLGLPQYGIYIVWLLAAWAGVGVGMMFLVGAMKMIPEENMEAAIIDGAGYWRRLFSIILPQIRTTIFNLLILTYIFSMTSFDFSFLLGGVAGGINYSLDVMSLFFYRVAFGSDGEIGGTLDRNAMGMGTTIACVMFCFILIMALLQLYFSYRKSEVE